MKALALVLMMGCTLSAQIPVQRLTLQEAEAIGLRNHPRISAQRYRAEAAALAPNQVRAEALPFATGAVTGVTALDRSRVAAGGLNNPIIYQRLGTGVTGGQMLTDFGRNKNLVRSAESRAEAQREVTELTRAEVVLQVDRAFYGLLRAQAVLRVAEKTVDARQLVVDQVDALAKNSLRSTLDVSFANVNLAEATLNLEQQRNEAESAQANLAAALGGSGEERFEPVDDAAAGPLNEDLNDLLQRATAKRPELASLRFEETAARQFASSESRLWAPTVSAMGSFGGMPAHVEELRGGWAAAGVNVSIPIFNGHLFRTRKLQADLMTRAAADRVRDAELSVKREVRVAYLGALSAHQRMGLAAKLLDQSRLALDLAKTRYELGLGTIVELSQAELGLTRAEIAETSARYEYLARRAELNFHVGENR
jgi:outer membrane protein